MDDDPNVLLFCAGVPLVELLNFPLDVGCEGPQIRIIFSQRMIDDEYHDILFLEPLTRQRPPKTGANGIQQGGHGESRNAGTLQIFDKSPNYANLVRDDLVRLTI